jgi:hypothetical protein
MSEPKPSAEPKGTFLWRDKDVKTCGWICTTDKDGLAIPLDYVRLRPGVKCDNDR